MKLYRTDGSLIIDLPEATSINALVEHCISHKISLSQADLTYANLAYVNLAYADLAYANLNHANLAYANLAYANLNHANLNQANLTYANLACANLNQADLTYADLVCADLTYANLVCDNLVCADLAYANLNHANLNQANLVCADLAYAKLTCADLTYANLAYADINQADLYHADLVCANLTDANLDQALNAEYSIKTTRLLHNEGDVIGWKKCDNGIIVKLLIKEGTPRNNAFGRKCRAQKAIVLEVIGAKIGTSLRNSSFIYEVGKEVSVPNFDLNFWNECSAGIHFYITRYEAEHN